MSKVHDPVEHPTHYNCREINCTKCGQRMEAGTICEVFTFWIGNCFKYLYRSDYKGKQIEDLKKAKQCIEMEIAKLTATTVFDVPVDELNPEEKEPPHPSYCNCPSCEYNPT